MNMTRSPGACSTCWYGAPRGSGAGPISPGCRSPSRCGDAIDRVVRKYAGALGLDRGYSAHLIRSTFITVALENDAQLEDVQKAAGHRDPHHQVLRSARLQPGESGELLCDVLSTR